MDRAQLRRQLAVPVFVAMLAGGCWWVGQMLRTARRLDGRASGGVKSARLLSGGQASRWWEGVPEEVRSESFTSTDSNIHPDDYAGPEACAKCHAGNYASWSQHPHRWMNALANAETVRGDFLGAANITYLGGRATFATAAGGGYRMRLERGETRREYAITQTIGSRFFQYYVGRQVSGPEPAADLAYSQDRVLPFGYWLDRREWVPGVHLHSYLDDAEFPEEQRYDPFAPRLTDHKPYAEFCNSCHTTFPLADILAKTPQLAGRNAPFPLHFATADYLAAHRPHVWDGQRPAAEVSDEYLEQLTKSLLLLDAPRHAVTLGVSCEACHLGAKEHATGKRKRPEFFPHSPHVYVEALSTDVTYGRTHTNVNYACGRCHDGERPQLAAGMGTWNSAEYTDALRGSCYSELTCIHCHNPHKGIGHDWPLAPEQDDALCLKCHQPLAPAEARRRHTHHAAGSEGSRCLNCHMPRLTEGLQEVVRTHMIFSPTRREMIEANHPNACNQCHTGESIRWTLKHLKEWYGREYSASAIAASYRHPDHSAALGWLTSPNESVRMIASDSLTRSGAKWAVPQLLDVLDDRILLNRQFTRIGLERMLDIKLADHGYQFWMTPQERRPALQRLRTTLLTPDKSTPTDGCPGP